MSLRTLSLLALAALAGCRSSGPPGAEEMGLRDVGIAHLENGQPAEAEATFRRLVRLVPDDPLPLGNLAVARLRQGDAADAVRWIDLALAKSPERPDLLAVKATALDEAQRTADAVEIAVRALRAAPDDPRLAFAVVRFARRLEAVAAQRALDEALGRLRELRPENIVTILEDGRRALTRRDRAEATAAFVRLGELGPLLPERARLYLDQVLAALEAADFERAQLPGERLANLLKATELYRVGLSELSPGVLGLPVERFARESAPPPCRDAAPIAMRAHPLDSPAGSVAGGAFAVADFDGDGTLDLARLEGAPPEQKLVLRRSADHFASAVAIDEVTGLSGLEAIDLDNDGARDLIGHGPAALRVWRSVGPGRFQDATAELGLAGGGALALAPIDFDLDGDLDLALVRPDRSLEVLRNAGAGSFAPVAAQALPSLDGARSLVATDLDRDGDPDLVVATGDGVRWLDNRRQGTFVDRSIELGETTVAPTARVLTGDLDPGGGLDVVALREDGNLLVAGPGAGPWKHLLRAPLAPTVSGASLPPLLLFDADNDGRLDVAGGRGAGVIVAIDRQSPGVGTRFFEEVAIEGTTPLAPVALRAVDLDADGDLDLLASGPGGLTVLENVGGNRGHWLDVRLRAITTGSSKNNVNGVGASVELRGGGFHVLRESEGDVVHLGLACRREADVLRVVWPNGVPQNRMFPSGDQVIVEEQLLKGSCPFLYAWTGERVSFVTDLLWNAPLGLPVAPGVFVPADPDELVVVDGAVPRAGVYDLRITEELWEAAYVDRVRLWVADAPPGVEVATSLNSSPGERGPDRILGSAEVRPVAAAWDGEGRDVTELVRDRDERYADGYARGPYQGAAAGPWTFTIDLGVAPAAPVRLLLDGWIFPSDASLNLAMAQRPGSGQERASLEVETADGWRTWIPRLGTPSGKTKTLVVEVPALAPGVHRLRIVSSLWLSWDRLAWTTHPADDQPVVRARLEPVTSVLGVRGFSRRVRLTPNGPHLFDYGKVSTTSPWLVFPGTYTRTGDVRPLLQEADDRYVILASGDELALTFDATALQPPPDGWRRTVFLETSGWDKDADRNTFEPQQLEPLPFRSMSGYPWSDHEAPPDTPEAREFRATWLTRRVAAGDSP